MHKTSHLVFVLLAAITTVIAGCGEDSFSGSCSLCFNSVPVGPSADQQACTAWGDLFGCSEATLINAGMCGEDSATCQVSDCDEETRSCTVND